MKSALQHFIDGCLCLIETHIMMLCNPGKRTIDNEAIYKWSKIKAHLEEVRSAIENV